MSDYLARLLARAAPLEPAGTADTVDIRPAAVEGPLGDQDPFENTVLHPAEWPAPSRADRMSATPQTATAPHETAAPPTPEALYEVRPAALRQMPDPIPAAGYREAPPLTSAETIREVPAAPTLRPPRVEAAGNRELPAEPAPATAAPRADDPLSVADRFMSGVLPAALLPPPVRIEQPREVVRETRAVQTLQPAPAPPPIAPPAPSYLPEAEHAAPTGLVIGRLSVTVVPPAAPPATLAAAPPPPPSRVVVVRPTAAAAPGVPSFSRFG